MRRERIPEVRRWLDNYQKLKETIEAIWEINHDLPRPEKIAAKRGEKIPLSCDREPWLTEALEGFVNPGS